MQCGGHVFPLSQFGFEARDAQRVRVLPRRNAHRPAERALQMGGAQPGASRKIPQGRHVRPDFSQFRCKRAGPDSACGLPFALARMAALASPKSGLFRRPPAEGREDICLACGRRDGQEGRQ